MKNKIQNSLQENLSSLHVSPQRHRELMQRITEGAKGRTRRATSLALALLLLLLAAVAIAWGLSYSPDVSTTRMAREAIMETYGLSRDAMDLFFAKLEKDATGTTLSFSSHDVYAKPFDQMGTYTVLVKNGKVEGVSWSHDDVDPAVWAGESLEAEAWGEKQLLAYRRLRDQENLAAGTNPSTGEEETLFIKGCIDETNALDLPRQGNMTEAQALAAAQAVMKEALGFSDETLALFEPYTSLAKTEAQRLALWDRMRERFSLPDGFAGTAPALEDAGGLWVVLYHPAQRVDSVFSKAGGPSLLGDYLVLLSDETETPLEAKWSLEGVDSHSYTESTWGQARAYSIKLLPWVAKVVDTCAPILEAYEATPGALPVEASAAHDQALRDAGFDPTLYNHVLPQPGDISYDTAVEMVAQVLHEACGVSRAVFNASGFAYADLTQEEDHREWYFWVQNAQEQCGWTVVLNAETGQVTFVQADPFAQSNG